MADKKSKEESGSRTVQRALDILYCFSEERQELTLTDISKEMNLAMSTTTRLLKALEMNHFVEKNPDTMKYRLGQRLYLLGYIAGKSIKLRELAKPLMYALRDETKETVNLYVMDATSRVCIEQAEGRNRFDILSRLVRRRRYTQVQAERYYWHFKVKNFNKKY